MEEIWKDVVGFENLYIVSNMGNVMSLGNGDSNASQKKLLKQWNRVRKYLGVSLQKDGMRHVFQSHRVVATSFIPNPNNYSEVNHINGIQFDNRVENLEWCSHAMNIQHAYDTGLIGLKVGTQRYNAKFKDEDIRTIRELANQGMSKNEIAKQFQVVDSTIYRIVRGTTWNHI